MNKHQEQLRTEPIPKLLLKQSIPAMVGLLVMSLYNVVDTIFIGQGVGTLAIAGLAITFPITMIAFAFAQAIGMGSSSIISRALGARDHEKAEHTLGNFFTLIVIESAIVMLIGLVFMEPLLHTFGASAEVLPYAREYFAIVIWGIFFSSFAASGNFIIRSEGNAKFAMSIMISSSLINIILDPIFIFSFDMGLKGAAFATVIAQAVAAIVGIYYFASGKSSVKIHLKNLAPKYKIVKETLSIGSSALARHVSMSLMTAILNNALALYGGDIAIASFGVINRVLMVVFMPMFGIVQGMLPILGYNYGAKQFSRARQSIILAIKYSSLIAFTVFIILMVFPHQIIMIFSSDQELIDLSARAMRIIIITLPFIGFQVIGGGVYQAIGHARMALFMSLLRQVIILIPLVIILPMLYQLNGIWAAFPIADLLSTIVTFFIIRRLLHRLHVI
ncbi:MATE family efflux transporter [Patescibacteria group bacterium]|nr:MATE family efflux transporter [Patescibacteria group bacterium]